MYLFAKFGFDTAEDEPCKVCPLSVYRLLLQIPQVGAKEQETKKEEKAIATESSTSRRTQAREMDLVENGWRSFGQS